MKHAKDDPRPDLDRPVDRGQKEALLRQRGLVIWFYGLSGAGKSTLASRLEQRLYAQGILTQRLDGDQIRTGLNRHLGFSDEERRENIRRIAEVAKLFANAGVVTLTSFITPKREFRSMARSIIGPSDFLEVFVKCCYETCETRDVKGLYRKARSGALSQFTGRDSVFEPPDDSAAADLEIDTETLSIEEAEGFLYERVRGRIRGGSSAR